MNLSSVVIQTRAEKLENVLQIIKQSEFCEYHIHDEKGRIIVTIEGKDTSEEVAKLKMIQNLPDVSSAEMVFAYSEDELENEKQKLDSNDDNLPKWLNDPEAKLKDIKYNGDLKGGV